METQIIQTEKYSQIELPPGGSMADLGGMYGFDASPTTKNVENVQVYPTL